MGQGGRRVGGGMKEGVSEKVSIDLESSIQ